MELGRQQRGQTGLMTSKWFVCRRQQAVCVGCVVQGAKSKYMVELQKERDTLAKEKTALLQKLQAVTQASAEERKRLEQTYKDKLTAVERRLKDLAEREKAAKRNAAQLVSSCMTWPGMHQTTLFLGDSGSSLNLQHLIAPCDAKEVDLCISVCSCPSMSTPWATCNSRGAFTLHKEEWNTSEHT
jgi:hypothetical protein